MHTVPARPPPPVQTQTHSSTLLSPQSPNSNESSASLMLTPEERQLFATHSVASLKQIAEDKRNQSDDKREELRQLVGIRYRVLIETADSIMKMQQLVTESRSQYESIQTLLPQMSLANTNETPGPPSQMQLLLMLRTYAFAPVSIWNYLDAHDFDAAISLYVSMQGLAARLEQVEHWPLDSQADHPELKTLIDTALQAHSTGGGVPSTSLTGALSSFFQLHASYYLEIPSRIAWSAKQRLAQRSLSTKSYAAALAALAVCSTNDSNSRANGGASSSIAESLLDQFLESRKKQLHDLLWSAEHALQAFETAAAAASEEKGKGKGKNKAATGGGRKQNPTPVLEHALQHVIFLLQHTLLDSALLFASIHPDVNPHAKEININNALLEEWKECNLAERVREIQLRVRSGSTSSASSSQAQASSFLLPAATLSAKLQTWLSSVSTILSTSLTQHLLPHLSRASTPGAKFSRVRTQVLKAANWEEVKSGMREEDGSTGGKIVVASSTAGGSKMKIEEEKSSSALSSPSPSPSTMKDVPGSPTAIRAAEQASAARKRLKQRWQDSCLLLFGRPSTSGAAAVSSTAAIDLFDRFFHLPFKHHVEQLIHTSFEKLTLVRKVEQYLSRENQQSEKDRARIVAQQQQGKEKRLLVSTEEDEEEESQEEEKKSSSSSHNRNPSQASIPANRPFAPLSIDPSSSSAAGSLELYGAREEEVQSIVGSFRSQLLQLGKECAAMVHCEYCSPPPSSSASTTGKDKSSFSDASSTTSHSNTPLLFPILQRYLQEELTPFLTKKYNQLVEKLVGQLKKKLGDLEQSVLHSMSDVSAWRSTDTLELVEQSVFIGRICQELMKQRNLMSLETLLEQAKKNPATSMHGRNSSTTPTGAASNNQLHSSLSSTAKSAFRIWTRYLSARLSEDFVEEFDALIGKWKGLAARGEQVEAQFWKAMGSNHNHSGSTPLGLFLPIHPSPFITQLIFSVHSHYYRCFGYRVHSEILAWLLADIVQALLSVWEKKVLAKVQRTDSTGEEESGEDLLKHLSPAAAMQMSFDLQYLFAVLRLPPTTTTTTKGAVAAGPLKVNLPSSLNASSPSGSGEPRARYTRLLGVFDSHLGVSLDQIDWMTSKPSFTSNLHAAVGRAAMLHGVLCKTNPFPPTIPPSASLATPAPTAGGVDGQASAPLATNILPLAAVATKILPLPTSLYPSKHPQPAPAPRPALSLTSSLTTPFPASTSSATSTSSSATTTTPAAPVKAEGLSFSNISSNLTSQFASANASAAVNAKAIGDLGSSLFGKLSSALGKK